MSSQRQKIENFMESPGSSETMVFDPTTGKLTVQSKVETQRRQQQPGGADRQVMLDMNKQGPGGFFLLQMSMTQRKY